MMRLRFVLACVLTALAVSAPAVEAQEWLECPETVGGGSYSGTLIGQRWRSTWTWEQWGNPWESGYWAGFVEHRQLEGVYTMTGGGKSVVSCGTLTLI